MDALEFLVVARSARANWRMVMRLERRLLTTVAATLMLAACDGEVVVPPEPPGAPEVDDVVALTNQNPITITGTAEAGALVQVRGGADLAEATADNDGAFSIDVTLTADTQNALIVSQTVEMLEGPGVTVMVTHDGTAPATPTIDPVITPTRRTMQTIRGTTEPGAAVTITGGNDDASGTADDSGSFEISVSLETTETGTVDNDLSIVATDLAGNASAAAEVSITFDPSITIEAPALDTFPAFTSASTIMLSGEAEAGVGIRAVGGATDGDTTVAADGTFSVDVGLRPNQRNMILVFAVQGSETSIAAVAVITHDDIAPAAPHVEPQASPTGADTVTLVGTAEPGVALDVTGGAADVTGAADAAGDFALEVMLTEDSDNMLSVVATDAAGNESDPTALAITHDGTLEDPIRVDAVVSPTQDPTVTLTGTATADIDVEITGGAATVTVRSGATDGSWSAEVTLNANARNELRVTRPGSGVDTIVVIVHDDTAPAAPMLNELASPTSSTAVAVSGTSEANARISISGGVGAAMGTAGADGRFSVNVTIAADASSTLSVIATDRAGNSSPASTATVTHSSTVPDAPVVDELTPAPTNVATYTVIGHVTAPGAGVTIRITGGASAATGPTDPATGAFSIDVTLAANVINTLTVVSLTGTIESAPTIVTITHDDIAPARPVAASISVTRNSGGVGACPGGLFMTTGNVRGSEGTVEGLSTARVENFSRAAGTFQNVRATELGTFTVTIASCAGDVMRIRAIDAAGNVSDFAEVNSP